VPPQKQLHYGSVPVYIHQQLKAKMPAAGATQALRLFNNPLDRLDQLDDTYKVIIDMMSMKVFFWKGITNHQYRVLLIRR